MNDAMSCRMRLGLESMRSKTAVTRQRIVRVAVVAQMTCCSACQSWSVRIAMVRLRRKQRSKLVSEPKESYLQKTDSKTARNKCAAVVAGAAVTAVVVERFCDQ